LMLGRSRPSLRTILPFQMKETSMNTTKRYFAAIISSAFISLSVGATEVYNGNLTAPNNMQRDTIFSFTLEYDANPDNTLKGILQCHPQCGSCFRADRVVKGLIEDNKLTFDTDTSEVQGCGKHVFRGVKDGDNWVGTMNFQGGRREITFKKK
jgi:hypothetical protein